MTQATAALNQKVLRTYTRSGGDQVEERILEAEKRGTVTLLYSAHDPHFSNRFLG